ncbi:glycine receptor subunit alpha-3 [Caerostris extrusa]|uniref:Glycine receptor subunit alpha-3 n=1 Tax=Caerostris extrusa TaxID=172846 RepID=A0AAV4N069_CAEEX|nr:glycine receptor subunit alpha-3 [Caerostris extrusa]
MVRPRLIFCPPFWLVFGLLCFYLYGVVSSVQGGLSFNDILPEDPKIHTLLIYFFAQTWKDPRLRLPENMTSEYRLLEVQWLENMWRPDSYFKNAKSVTFQTMTIRITMCGCIRTKIFFIWSSMLQQNTRLAENKEQIFFFSSVPTVRCFWNQQIFSLNLEPRSSVFSLVKRKSLTGSSNSLSYTTDDLLFDWEEQMPLAVDENIELPQLDLVKTERGDCTQVYSTGDFNLTICCHVMSCVPEAVPARVTLGVTSLLTLSTQHAKSQASLPPVSYIKAIDIFMSSCTFFVFLSLMEYALVNVVLEDEQATFRQMNNDNTRIFNLQPKLPGLTPVQKRRKKAIKIDRFSRFLFPLSFVILNISYWVYYVGLL